MLRYAGSADAGDKEFAQETKFYAACVGRRERRPCRCMESFVGERFAVPVMMKAEKSDLEINNRLLFFANRQRLALNLLQRQISVT